MHPRWQITLMRAHLWRRQTADGNSIFMAAVKLTDKDFLDDYVCFGVWQPAIFSTWLSNQLSENGGFNKSAALQIYLNFEIALEMLAKWYFALAEWQPGTTSLTRTFDRIDVKNTPDNPYTVDIALDAIDSHSAAELLTLLKQPTSDALRARGWTDQEVSDREADIKKLVDLLGRALGNRSSDKAELLRAYNKLKHGFFAFQELPGQTDDGGVALVHKINADGSSGVLVEPIWLPVERGRLVPIVDTIISICQIAAVLLANITWFYFTSDDWQTYKSNPSSTGAMIEVIKKIQAMRTGN
jgi:hypothetical protein